MAQNRGPNTLHHMLQGSFPAALPEVFVRSELEVEVELEAGPAGRAGAEQVEARVPGGQHQTETGHLHTPS